MALTHKEYFHDLNGMFVDQNGQKVTLYGAKNIKTILPNSKDFKPEGIYNDGQLVIPTRNTIINRKRNSKSSNLSIY